MHLLTDQTNWEEAEFHFFWPINARLGQSTHFPKKLKNMVSFIGEAFNQTLYYISSKGSLTKAGCLALGTFRPKKVGDNFSSFYSVLSQVDGDTELAQFDSTIYSV